MNNHRTYTGIHSEVPEEYTDTPGVTIDYDERREKIFMLLHGASRFLTANDISTLTGIEDKHHTKPVIRKLIKEINYYAAQNAKPFAVISNSNGYKMATDSATVCNNIERLERRMQGLKNTINYNKVIYNRLLVNESS